MRDPDATARLLRRLKETGVLIASATSAPATRQSRI
jgi:hypothetical protein